MVILCVSVRQTVESTVVVISCVFVRRTVESTVVLISCVFVCRTVHRIKLFKAIVIKSSI